MNTHDAHNNDDLTRCCIPKVRRVQALQQIRRMRGGAQSQLMRCSDEGLYIVKFQNNPQGLRILFNELLGAQIARSMGLPTPEFAVVDVSHDLIRHTEELVIELAHGRASCQPGACFGSRYIGDPGLTESRHTPRDFIPDAELLALKNLRDFAGMLVFDQWTCNTDGRQTVFLREAEDRMFRAWMIDNGFCFGATEWRFDDGPLRGLFYRKTVYRDIRTFEAFEPWLDRVERRLGLESLQIMASSIPEEWYGNRNSVEELLCRLDRRRPSIRELLRLTVRSDPVAFPNFETPRAFIAAASSRGR